MRKRRQGDPPLCDHNTVCPSVWGELRTLDFWNRSLYKIFFLETGIIYQCTFIIIMALENFKLIAFGFAQYPAYCMVGMFSIHNVKTVRSLLYNICPIFETWEVEVNVALCLVITAEEMKIYYFVEWDSSF